MKESDREDLASNSGHEPYAGSGDAPGVAWVSGDAGQPLSSDIVESVCRSCSVVEKATPSAPSWQGADGHGGVEDPVHASKFQAREPGDPADIRLLEGATFERADRSENVHDGTAGMNVGRKSDGSVVPAKSANKGVSETPAERMEERDSVERNAAQPAPPRTPSRNEVGTCGLDRVRGAARESGKLKFTALLHHADVHLLRRSFFKLKKKAAVGIDGVTWHDYEHDLEEKLIDLHGRIHRGSYRAKPSRRSYIDKPDGRKRKLGVTSLEDKIVQHAVGEILQSVYEEDFLGFSYGFRRGKCQHDALDALSVAISDKKVKWILDADIEGFFDTIDHDWMIAFLEHRIGGRRVLRLIKNWLKAGVSEDGEVSETWEGTPQGGVISPLLSNVYLHYVFDLWIQWWRKSRCRGDVVVVRYADDFVIGFESRDEAEACLEEIRVRFAKFGLKLHDGKTRLIEFGRFAATNRKQRGENRPETFDFLGFTHKCGRTRKGGHFAIHRHTVAKRMRATLAAIKGALRKRRHRPLSETGKWLGRVVRGWMNYHAIPGNDRTMRFFKEVTRHWLRSIRRRSQKGRSAWTWERMIRFGGKYLPRVRVIHPYPSERFHARLKTGAV